MMRATTLLVLPALFTGSTAPSPVPAQDQAASWTPPIPLQGSLLRVAVPAAPPPLDTVPPAASLADEPLHFTRDTAGGWTALAAVPLAAGDSVILWLRPAGRADSVAVRVPVTLRPTGVERLGTDPEFTAPLDSALAERVRREAESVAAALRGTHERPPLWTREFQRPRTTRVTSPFGQGRSYNAGEAQGRHRGADLAGARGEPVHAANRGVVVLAGELFYAGRSIYVDHGAGIATAYLHLERVQVSTGDTVERGQVIGQVGSSGRVTGPHLHWAAYFGRVAFDPFDLLALQSAAGHR